MGLPGADPVARATALPGLVLEAVAQNFTPEQWNAGSKEERQGVIDKLQSGIREKYQDVFSVEVAPARKETRTDMITDGGFGMMPREREVEIPAVKRPLYYPETEKLIADVRGGGDLPDFSAMDQKNLLGTYALLAQAAPERVEEMTKAVKSRAQDILKDRGYPTSTFDDVREEHEIMDELTDDSLKEPGFLGVLKTLNRQRVDLARLNIRKAKTFGKEATAQFLALAGPMGAGPLTDLANQWKPGDAEKGGGFLGSLEKGVSELTQDSLLSADNRALATIAYGDEQQWNRFLGTTLPYIALGNAALRRLGVSALSVKGIGAQAAVSTAIGAAQGPEYVPSMIAEAAGLEPNRLTAALEAGGIDAVFGIGLRKFGQVRFLNRLRREKGWEDVKTMKQAKARYEDWKAANAKNVSNSTPELTDAGPPAQAEPPPAARDPRAEVEAKIDQQNRREAVTPAEQPPVVMPADEIGGRAVDDIEYSEMDTGGGSPVEAPAPETGAVQWQPPIPPPEALRNVMVPAAGAKATLAEGQVIEANPLQEIAVRPDLMQFKRSEEAETGVNAEDRLADTADWDPYKGGNLLVWEPVDPKAYELGPGERFIVANGHHRMEFAKRKGVDTVNVQVLREADGVSAGDARAYAAEINIADGKGNIYDQAKFIRNEAAAYGADAAMERARQIGARGRKAATIGIEAEDNLFDAFTNEQISPEAAAAIATTAPGDAGLQALGIKQSAKGRSPAEIRADLQLAARVRGAAGTGDQSDLFGADDSAMQAMERTSDAAIALQRAARERILSVRGALNNPELARKMGVDPGDTETLRARVEALVELENRAKNFATDDEILRSLSAEDFDPQATVERMEVGPARENQGGVVGEERQGYGQGLSPNEALQLNQLQKRVLGGRTLTPGQTREMELLQRKLGQQDFDFYQPAGADASQRELEDMRQKLKAGAAARLRGEELQTQVDLFGAQPAADGQISLFEAAHRYAAVRSMAEQVADPTRQNQIFEDTYNKLREIERIRQSGRSYQFDLDLDLGDKGQGPLFSQGGGAGGGAPGNTGRPPAPRDVHAHPEAALRGNPQALKQALEAGETITAWVSKAITGNVAGWNPHGKIVRGPADMAALRMELSNHLREIDTITAVDTRTGKVVANEIGGIGALSSSIADPAAFARVMDSALRTVPVEHLKVYDVHNHPSGDVNPSQEDRNVFLNRVKQASLRGLTTDQVEVLVTDTNKYFEVSKDRETKVKSDKTLAWEAVPRDDLFQFTASGAGTLTKQTAALMNTLRQSKETRLYGIFLNIQNRIVAAKRLPHWDESNGVGASIREIATFSSNQGASSVILIDTAERTLLPLRSLADQIRSATGGQVYLQDAASGEVPSAYEAGILSEPKKNFSQKLRGKQLREEGKPYAEGEEQPPEPVGPYYTDGVPDVQPLAVRFGAPPKKLQGDMPDPAPDKGWIKTGMGGLEKISAIEMPELVDLVKALQAEGPILKRLPKASGYFRPGSPFNAAQIVIDPRIFQNYRMAERTISHEIGHLIDFLDEGTMNRGNILGRIGKLREYLARSIDRLPKDPSQALTPKDRAGLRSVAVSKAGPRPPKDAESAVADWNAEVSRLYKEEVEVAMDERDLITTEQVGNELKELTRWWHPFDPATATETYLKYRHSGVELYAEALSVLLSAPRELKTRAPKFWDSFFGYLDRSPEAKQEFFSTWDFLNRPYRQVIEKRRNKRLAGYATGDELMKDAMEQRKNRNNNWTGLNDRIRTEFWDVYWPIVKRAKEAKRAGNQVNPNFDPEKFFDEHPFAEGGIYKFIQDVHEKVVRPLEEREISTHQLGEFLEINRVANEAWVDPETGQRGGRASLANPGGETTATARKALMEMRVRLGMETMTHLEFYARKFQDQVFKVMRDAKGAGLLGDDLWELIQKNRYNYAAFVSLNHVSDRVSGAIKAQFGTLTDTANPFTSSVLKMASVKRAIQENQAKMTTVGFMNEFAPDEIKPAPLVWNGRGQSPKAPEDPDLGLIEMRVDGKAKGYHVPKDVAEMFEQLTPGRVNAVLGTMNLLFRQYLYPLIITYNSYFQLISSPNKDVQRALVNMPGGQLKMTGKTLVNYKRLIGDLFGREALNAEIPESLQATRDFLKGRPNPLISEMLELNMLGSPMEAFSALPRNDQESFTAILEKFRVIPEAPKGRILSSLGGRAVRKLGKGIEFAGVTFEMLPKVEGYRILTRDLGWPKERAGHYVRNYIGVPNFRAKGKHTDSLQGLLPFWNVFQRGLVSDMNLALAGSKARVGAGKRGGSRTAWWMRFAGIVGVPTMLQVLAEMGIFGEELQHWYEGKSEYTKTNYLVVPLGWSKDEGDFGKKPVGIRVPLDETHRLLRGIVRKAMLSAWSAAEGKERDHSPSQILSFGAGQIPGLNPIASIPAKWVTYLSGGNPTDDFRDQQIIGRAERAAGGWPALKDMIVWTAGATAVTNFVRYNPEARTTTEAVISGIPGLNRLLDFSDYGYREQQNYEISQEEAARARVRLGLGETAQQLAGEYFGLRRIPNDKKTPNQMQRYKLLSAWHREIYTPVYEGLLMEDISPEAAESLNKTLESASQAFAD